MQRNSKNLSLAFTAWAFWNREYDNNMKNEVLRKAEIELYRRYCERFKCKKTIKVLYTTDYIKKKIYSFYDGIFFVPSDWLLGACIPVVMGDEIWYGTTYENPWPEKEITKIEFRKIMNGEFNVFTKKITQEVF